MSMFHELMMRKKEQIMYATIKGSLTENDGVFSGFSDSNYLEMQQAIPNLDVNSFLEIELKVTMPETITRQQIVGTNNANYTNNSTFDIGFQVYDDNRLWAHIYNSTSEERNAVFLTAPSALNGKVCYIKYTIANSRMTISLSFDKITWVSNYYDLPTTFSYTKASRSVLGWGKGNSAFAGSIDLNNSYIKLGSTKYNLQAVVGYTVVGSPTITDGVVSGFSRTDYLIINKEFDTSKNFEIVIKANTGTISGEMNALLRNYSATNDLSFSINVNPSNSKLYSSILDTNGNYILQTASGITVFDNNTDYLFRFSQKEVDNEYVIKIESSTDGITWVTENIATSSNYIKIATQGLKFGAGHSSYAQFWKGNIDMNKTYVKLGNKLWFNGQPA